MHTYILYIHINIVHWNVYEEKAAEYFLTILLLLWQCHEVLQHFNERGELICHLKFTADGNPEVHIVFQSQILHIKHIIVNAYNSMCNNSHPTTIKHVHRSCRRLNICLL